ncbi:MAG TPA: SDR family oxidoreductase [Gemmatimonadaceae bacterium]|nr:SDR family oxidoreductase [Gemmatimonadaceae bacterium]
MKLDGRIALVTGGGRRVGRAIATALGERHMHVAVHYNGSASGATETASDIEKAGGKATLFQSDLSQRDSPAQLVDEVAAKLGALDVLVNSAAIMQRTPLESVTPADWDATFALNARAPFFAAVAAGRHMAEKGGAIVNIADLAALETWPAYIPHGLSKTVVVQMTRALARTLAPDVRVNAIAPGVILLPDGWDDEASERLRRTTPLKRLGSVNDVVGAVIYLLEADYVTGETIVVDGGRHVRR